MKLFSTTRLDARRLTPADASAMYAIYGDSETVRWVGDGVPLTLDECHRWVDVSMSNYESRGYGMSAVIERESGDMIGCCGIVHPGGQREAEIKYAFRRDQWGRGFANEVVPAMLDYGFQTLKLARIIATVDPENCASIHLLTKHGMGFVNLAKNEDGTETATYALSAPSTTAEAD
jgi:[ribosomal protein S5]-alanine N-acetyltransferase